MAEPFASCCGLRHEHEHAAHGWVLTLHSAVKLPGKAKRFGYSMNRPGGGYSSAARYASADSAMAAGRADCEACP